MTARPKEANAPPWAAEARQRVEQFEAAFGEALTRLEQAMALASQEQPVAEWLREAPEQMRERAANTAKQILAHVDEALRPKGPIVDVEHKLYGNVRNMSKMEVARVTPTQIVMHDGVRFYRDTGAEIRRSTDTVSVITRESLDRIEQELRAHGASSRGGRGKPREAASSPSRPGDHNEEEQC